MQVDNMTKKLTYSEFTKILDQMDVQINAAEAHGVLVGMLSVVGPKNDSVWRVSLLEILDCNQPDKQQWALISKLKTKISKDLKDRTFSFNLLLPNDDSALAVRILALSEWCKGYLSGLGLVGISAVDLSNEIIKELIQDLSQIAQVGQATDASNDDEKNFLELVEYVRIAVQNIYVELRDAAIPQILH